MQLSRLPTNPCTFPPHPFAHPPRVPHSRPPLSPPRRRRRRFHLSFHPAPSSHRVPPQLVPPPRLTLPIRPTARLAALPTPDAVRRATPDRVPTKLLATPDDSGSGNRDSSKRRTSPVTRAVFSSWMRSTRSPGTLTKRARSSRKTTENEIDRLVPDDLDGWTGGRVTVVDG